ncbi:MAG: protein kinase [Bacteroidales bacterium]|nr:protein kinase [Bacteroidales bacterium]
MPVAQRCEFGVGDVIGPGFKVQRILGNGAFGIVYKVIGRDSREYALKLLKLWAISPDHHEKLRERFVMEYNTGLIDSPNLVHSFSYGEVNGNPYIQMEYCPLGDLRDYSKTHQVNQVAVARDILNGLGALHSRGKVHRDLKPENVLLREDTSAVLTDFGISGDQNKRMTERGFMGKPQQIFGTFPYMPPEQVNPPRGGQATVLPTTDIFSFGVLMYELIVGKLPFGELNENTLPRYLQNGKDGRWDREALKLADNSGVWGPVIEGCLRPDFHHRIQTTKEVMEKLPATGIPAREPSVDSFHPVVNGTLLRIMQGEDYGKVYYLDRLLGGRLTLTMGRDDELTHNQIPVLEESSKYISRHHCTLEKDPLSGQWYIRDGQLLGGRWRDSLNGTYVNSREADRYGVPFKPGDIISIGDVKLRVEGY